MDLSIVEVSRKIYLVRGYQIVLDKDLAEFYQVETGMLNRAVKRNKERFPEDFMFQVTEKEKEYLLKQGLQVASAHGGRRHLYTAFT